MNPLNLQVLINTSGVSGDRLVQAMQALRSSKHKDRMVQFTNINFANVGPGFGQRAAQQLEADAQGWARSASARSTRASASTHARATGRA